MILEERDQYMGKQEKPEQSRLLWILLSALSVIAIVVAAGIFFFFPSADGETGQPQLSSLNTEPRRDIDHVEIINADGYPEMVEPETTDSEFAVDGDEVLEAPMTEDVTAEPEIVTEDSNVVEVTTPKIEAVEEKIEIPVPPVVKKQETMKVSVTVYWIQVGSYHDLTKAEEVRSYLLTKDISSEIQTKAVDGKTYYRIRIGAFQSKGEADRFLDPIKSMKNFDESYVVQTTMIKEVPVN